MQLDDIKRTLNQFYFYEAILLEWFLHFSLLSSPYKEKLSCYILQLQLSEVELMDPKILISLNSVSTILYWRSCQQELATVWLALRLMYVHLPHLYLHIFPRLKCWCYLRGAGLPHIGIWCCSSRKWIVNESWFPGMTWESLYLWNNIPCFVCVPAWGNALVSTEAVPGHRMRMLKWQWAQAGGIHCYWKAADFQHSHASSCDYYAWCLERTRVSFFEATGRSVSSPIKVTPGTEEGILSTPCLGNA